MPEEEKATPINAKFDENDQEDHDEPPAEEVGENEPRASIPKVIENKENHTITAIVRNILLK